MIPSGAIHVYYIINVTSWDFQCDSLGINAKVVKTWEF